MKAFIFAMLVLATPAWALDKGNFDGTVPLKGPLDPAQLAPRLEADGIRPLAANRLQDSIRFEGQLRFKSDLPSGYKVHVNEFGYRIDSASNLAPSDFTFSFVQDGDRLIPTSGLPVSPEGAGWEVLIGEGHIWREGEEGRISFGFTLREPNANCLHNGLLSLRFDEKGLSPRAVYQITSETCAYYKFDLWGTMRAGFAPYEGPDRQMVLNRQKANDAKRLKSIPLSGLMADLTSDMAKPFGARSVNDPPAVYGFAVGDTIYASDCETRAGHHPLCADLDLPSYSTAKTLFAAVALMRLEALYPGVSQLKIADLVPQCADWGAVRLIDALDMATGRYDDAGYEVDEGHADMQAFFNATTHAERISLACGHYKRMAEPGKIFVYHTTDTYVVGAAMQAFYRQKHPGGDVYREVLKPLWDSLSLSPRLDDAQRTLDGVKQPLTGYGLTYKRDDVIRMARWLLSGNNGLDPVLRDQALQRTADRGLSAFPPDYRYQHGVWARNIAPVLGCKSDVWTPFMSGYGGISVVMFSNDILFFYYGDAQQFDWSKAIKAAHQIKGICS